MEVICCFLSDIIFYSYLYLENEQQINYELRQMLKKLKNEVLPSEDKTYMYIRDKSINKGTEGIDVRTKVYSVYLFLLVLLY